MAKRPASPKGPTLVDAIKRKDTRKNIPTEVLRDFIAEDEATPSTMLYPRDPSLDPQLAWKGKDDQDRDPLAVPVDIDCGEGHPYGDEVLKGFEV